MNRLASKAASTSALGALKAPVMPEAAPPGDDEDDVAGDPEVTWEVGARLIHAGLLLGRLGDLTERLLHDSGAGSVLMAMVGHSSVTAHDSVRQLAGGIMRLILASAGRRNASEALGQLPELIDLLSANDDVAAAVAGIVANIAQTHPEPV